MSFIEWGVLTLQRQPRLLRTGLGLAKRVLPRRLMRHVVDSADAVRETFARSEDFWMGYLNAPKMKLGRFVLGMDPPYRDYVQEKEQLVDTLTHMSDQIGEFASVDAVRAAEHLGRALRDGGELDLVSIFAEPVYTRALSHCFGVPVRGTPCPLFQPYPNHEPLARYIRTFGSTIGSDHPAPFGLEALATNAAPYFREHLDRAIRAHRSGDITAHLPKAEGVSIAPEDTVLGRLIKRAPFADGDAGIVRSVAGMMSASAGFPRAFASVLHELLLRPEHLRGFVAALRAQDEARVAGYVREALRFRPVFPILVRHCPYKTTLSANGSEYGNSEVVPIFPATAMFDPARVERPELFNPQRPESIYFLFGGAPRECIGKPMMMKLFMPLFSALFRELPQLLHAQPGSFRYDGPALAGYDLRLAASPHAREPRVRPRIIERERRQAISEAMAVARVTVEETTPQPPAACPMHGLRFVEPSALPAPTRPSSVPEPAE
jgi:cytochrome P450